MSIDAVQAVVMIASPIRNDPPERRRPAPAVESAPVRAATVSQEPRPMPQAREVQVSASFGSGHLVVYRFVDKKTGDLIEQIPPEQFLQAAQESQGAPASDSANPKLDLKF